MGVSKVIFIYNTNSENILKETEFIRFVFENNKKVLFSSKTVLNNVVPHIARPVMYINIYMMISFFSFRQGIHILGYISVMAMNLMLVLAGGRI